MSDDGSGPHVRQSPRQRTEEMRVADFTMMVRIPGQPAAVRVYTDDEKIEAARYAAEVEGVVVALPLSPPTGYTAGLSGSLIPDALSEADRSAGLKSDRGQGPPARHYRHRTWRARRPAYPCHVRVYQPERTFSAATLSVDNTRASA